MEVLSQEIDSDEARYRIRAGDRVHYVTITRDLESMFDEETLCRPHLLLPRLPAFPDSSWTTMRLRGGPDSSIQSTILYDKLQGIEAWHLKNVEVTSLRRISSHKHRVQEVEFEGQPAIAKLAPFEWWNPMADRESLTYEIVTREHPGDQPPIAPKFLAQLTEEGRPMGFLLEKIEGQPAAPHDLPACESALRNLHKLGLVHGDMNRYNFIVEKGTRRVRMIDFEHASLYTAEKGEKELDDMWTMFSLDSRLGAMTAIVGGVEQVTAPMPYSV